MLFFLHLLVITLSNLLVQYPFAVAGIHTTWGAFIYPVIFILTDLTVRFKGQAAARSVVYMAMVPGLITSYVISVIFKDGSYQGIQALSEWQSMPSRIAFACFTAYVIGQLLDIKVFQRFRQNAHWWLAPLASSTTGNIVDTTIFFSIAFYNSSNVFMRNHWPEIAAVDLAVKIAISCIAFVPAYGILLKNIMATRESVGNPV